MNSNTVPEDISLLPGYTFVGIIYQGMRTTVDALNEASQNHSFTELKADPPALGEGTKFCIRLPLR
ncbi:MAG: hypothetical protein AAFN38_22860 [Cyanobacteria bacterium J06560_5]